MNKKLWFSVLTIFVLGLTSLAAHSGPGGNSTTSKSTAFGGDWGNPRKTFRKDASNPVLESTWRVGIDDSIPRSTENLLKDVLPKLSGDAADMLARKYKPTMVDGKKMDWALRATDQIVSSNNYIYENEPSMAVNPMNEAIVVVFTHYYDDFRRWFLPSHDQLRWRRIV